MMSLRTLCPILGLALLLSACKTELYSHLDEREANEMVAILIDRNIPADRAVDEKDHSYAVNVEKAQFADAVELLKKFGYPRQKFATVPDIFPNDGLVASPIAERARYLYAIDQDLSHTISEIDGVLSARVQVVVPDNDPMRQAPSSVPSASVFIRHAKEAALSGLVPQIKTMVANSVAGVAYDHVTVILVPAESQIESLASEPNGLIDVAGLWVHKTSAASARWLIGFLATMATASSGALAFTLLRQRRRQRGRLDTTSVRANG